VTAGVFIHQFELGPWDNFQYFIGDKATRTCAVVDPAWDLDTIVAEAARLDVRISAVLCTHSHFDHVDQVEPLLKRYDVPVHMLRQEVEFSGFRCENLRLASPGDTVTIGADVEVTLLHTPGHTPGSVCYRVDDAVVTGDTLFVDGCGRCDFVGGDPEAMYATLRRLCDELPGQTVMYPGHNYGPTPTATLDAQLDSNRYLRAPTVAEFIAHRMEGKTPGTVLPPRPAWSPAST
jgi:glyoxylase-like metal-dependent hydrolase (beta-lactamase superfamily II)